LTATVLHGDSFEVLPTEPYDVLYCDPPFSSHVHSSAVSQSSVRGARKRDMGFGHLTPSLRRKTCRMAARARRWVVIHSDMESTWLWRIGLEAAGCTYIRTIPWVRFSMPQLSGDRPPTGCEAVVIAYGSQRGRKHWNGPGNLMALTHKCLRGEGKHKAEKPLDQALDLVSYFSDPGELVMDPFSGSGTVGLACAILGRNFVGAELDPFWASHATDRINNYETKNPVRHASGPSPFSLTSRDFERYDRWQASLAGQVPKYKQSKSASTPSSGSESVSGSTQISASDVGEHDPTLPGWFCAYCRVFNGTAKNNLTICRACNHSCPEQ
jgi:site-specific DNA-methyltransferase (adenine-specific)